MILPEALHPSMSRGGLNNHQKVPLSTAQPDDFAITEGGIWLTQLEIAELDFNKTRLQLGQYAIDGATYDPWLEATADVINDAVFDDELGCWLPEGAIGTELHTEILWTIATREMGKILNAGTLAVKEKLHICTADECLNTRHYDFTYGVTQRQELLEPDPELYTVLADGRIKTAWGDILPSVSDSIAAFREFQAKCPPYASEKGSPLTANGISKITIDEHSGCWCVRTYYTKPPTIPNYQYDGYGRLTLRRHINVPHRTTGAQMLAHRVVWRASGRRLIPGKELNHLCGFRPCAYPDHLRQTSRRQNVLHGFKMQDAIAELRYRQ